jgi:hypothetical protein
MIRRICWHLGRLVGVVVCLSPALFANTIAFELLPSDGNVVGPAGSVVGWGYSIMNQSSSDWFLATDLNSDSFSHGTPTLLFDFPEVAPGATVAETFDAVNSIGLYELQWDTTAPAGFVNSGDFTLSGQWYDGDPFNGGNLINDAPDTLLPYAATVGSVSTPEPSCFSLTAVGGLFAGFAFYRGRRRKGLILRKD